MTHPFTYAFDAYKATGYIEPTCRDAQGNEVRPRDLISGDRVFDWPDKITAITGAFRESIVVIGPKPKILAGHRPGVVGSFPPNTPCFVDEATGMHTWVLHRNSSLHGTHEAYDEDGALYTIMVFERLGDVQFSLAPSEGVRTLTPFPVVGLPPHHPWWLEDACRGIGAQHVRH